MGKMNNLLNDIAQAKRPLCLLGQGVPREQVNDFLEFITRTSIPFGLSRLALDYVPYSMPLNLGCLGIKGQPYSHQVLAESDLIIALGHRVASTVLPTQPTAKIYMMGTDIADIRFPDVVHMDEKSGQDYCTWLSSWFRSAPADFLPDRSEWVKRCRNLKLAGKPWSPLQRHRLYDRDETIDLYDFMSALDAYSREQHILTTDAGSGYYVGGQVFQFEKGQRELTSGSFAAMGISLPLAIGAAVAEPNKQILAVTGDGSLELNLQELKTLAYYQLNVKLFVIANGGYVSMRKWQDQHFEGRQIETTDQNVFHDYALLAEAFGLEYYRMDNPGTL